MVDPVTDMEEAAREHVAGRRTLGIDGMVDLAEALKSADRFELARRLFAICLPEVAGDALRHRHVGQRLALCTYKSTEQPDDTKYDAAMDILAKVDDLPRTTDRESLGLAGAIRKRQWERQAKRPFLLESFDYYYRGYLLGVAEDNGYTGINAAYVLDCLAAQDQSTQSDAAARIRRRLARRIRQAIVDVVGTRARARPLEEVDNWTLVTLGEAAFALQHFDDARHWLNESARRARPEWECRTTATQLTALLRLMAKDARAADPARLAEARAVLKEYLGDDEVAVASVLRGKIGLALSGGGFRASFYHLGVLARLAELDLLRHVECLSCVSGGSIVGAHYYLELQKLLESRPDSTTADEAGIARDDYIDLVRRVQADFLAGVQTNIRTRVAAEFLTNLRMIFWPGYSRTMRVGELYEREIYARVQDDRQAKPRWLDELVMRPKGEDAHFRPDTRNWRRFAKVPTLVLNATTLNTGHCWQFTATWMGEATSGVSAIDANSRLRRLYHREAPKGFRRVRLGHAVAASACVPGLFDPLTLPDLYQAEDGKPMFVRLVDGGVHDNQGIATLIDQDCTVMIVSDASGQMDDVDRPGDSIATAPLRSNSILQARVRTAQYGDAASRHRGGLLNGLAFMHLKNGLDSRMVDWIECQDPTPAENPRPMLAYGVQRHLQRALAGIRTDLDSFSEAEAFALMADGYLMATQSLTQAQLGFAPASAGAKVAWGFEAINKLLAYPSTQAPLARHLEGGSSLFLKAWRQVPSLRVAGIALLAILGLASLYALWHWRSAPLFSISIAGLVPTIVSLVLGALGLRWLANTLYFDKTIRNVLFGVAMAFGGWFAARLHLWLVDPVFLRHGRLERLAEATRRLEGGVDRLAPKNK